MSSGYIRLIACVDIPLEDLTESYLVFRDIMTKGVAAQSLEGIGWETSDEAYGVDDEPIDEEVLQKAIEKAFEEKK